MNPSTQVIDMHNFATRQAVQQRRTATQIATVCVVDPQANDGHGWDVWGVESQFRLKTATSADEALRIARTAAVDLWVINTKLPGLSGLDLCRMLKARSQAARVCLVADEYSQAVEQSAWQAGASLFDVASNRFATVRRWLAHRFKISSESRE